MLRFMRLGRSLLSVRPGLPRRRDKAIHGQHVAEEARQRAGIAGKQTAKRLLEITDFERPGDGSVDETEVLQTITALREQDAARRGRTAHGRPRAGSRNEEAEKGEHGTGAHSTRISWMPWLTRIIEKLCARPVDIGTSVAASEMQVSARTAAVDH